MIRENLDPGSRFAMAYMTGGTGFRFATRPATSDVASHDGSVAPPEQGALRAPLWMKLERIGDEFNAYYSHDPATEGWTASAWNPQTVVLSSSIHVGLALTSHSAGNPTTAEFSGIELTGASGPWQFAEVGVDQFLNDLDDLYVALEDSLGRVATVSHPEPNAVATTNWTAWPIPLDAFTDINPAAVKKMYIGVGDRNQPRADGTGRVFIDDIRVTQGVPVEPNQVDVTE